MIYSRYVQRRFNVRHSSTLIPWATQNGFNSKTILSADGCYLNSKDKKIMDFTSGLMVVNLGHNNKHIMDGFKEHLDTGVAYVNSAFKTNQRDLLSERIVDAMEMEGGKVFYANGGGDANETAVFIAHEYQNTFNKDKKRVLTFEKSFHGGSTIGATLLSGDDRKAPKEKYYSLTFESIMENPSKIDNGKSSLEQMEQLFKNDDVAAIIVEGSSGSAGCIEYPYGYLKKVEILCKKYNIVLICDEVMSGWGRTGSLFAFQGSGIKPDIVTTAKGFTSGYVPLGCTVVSKEIASIYDNRPFIHGLTYFAHPLSCTIANRCLDLYLKDDQQIVKDAKVKGDLLYKLGKDIEKNVNIVKNYRNNGLLGCLELDINDDNRLLKISNKLLNKGVFCFRRKSMIFTAPPLIIDNIQLKCTMDIISKVLEEY